MVDLHRTNAVIISIGASSPEKSVDILTQKVQTVNATVRTSIALYEVRGSPTNAARQAGTQIALEDNKRWNPDGDCLSAVQKCDLGEVCA